MKIPTKEEYLKALRSNKDYQAVLKSAPNDERKKIIATVEMVTTSMLEAFSTVAAQTKQDPNFAKEVDEALKDGINIIKESDGSTLTTKEK